MNSANRKAHFHLIIAGIFVCLSATAIQCSKKTILNIPDCITVKIEAIKREPKWNPPAEVKEYEFNGRRVFLFSSNCCDQYNTAYDEGCNVVCSPSGGFTGRGDGKCPDFNDKAKFIRVVWKDPR